MQRHLLKSKIHRATVTDRDLSYEGSVTIDEQLMKAADILPFEQVDVYNISNGARFTTYAIPGKPGQGEVVVNGAAARLVERGDLVIVASYAVYQESELSRHRPRVVKVDVRNRPLPEMAPAV